MLNSGITLPASSMGVATRPWLSPTPTTRSMHDNFLTMEVGPLSIETEAMQAMSSAVLAPSHAGPNSQSTEARASISLPSPPTERRLL